MFRQMKMALWQPEKSVGTSVSRSSFTSIEQLVLDAVAQDISLAVGLLPADFEGRGAQCREHQPAGGVWNTGAESCI